MQKAVSDQRADLIENELEEFRMRNTDLENRYSRVEADNQSLNIEVKDLSQRLNEFNNSGLPAHLERVENELQETTAKLHQENVLRSDVENRLEREVADRANEQLKHQHTMNEMESLVKKMNAAHDKIAEMSSGEDRQRRIAEELRLQIQEQSSRIDELEGELQQEKYRVGQLTTENKNLHGQVTDATTEVSRIMQQNADREAQNAAENMRRTKEIESLQAYGQAKERELHTAIEEKRSLELMHVDEQRAIEAQHQHKLEAADTRYVQLQREYENMHKLLMRVQQENKSLTERLENQRKDSKDRMQQLTDALSAADERAHTMVVKHVAELNVSKDEIRTLQERLVEFCESALTNHEAMQTQVDRLRTMCGHVQGDCDILKQATYTTKSRVETVQQSLQQPIINFSNECKHRIGQLIQESERNRAELEDAKDQVSVFIFINLCLFTSCPDHNLHFLFFVIDSRFLHFLCNGIPNMVNLLWHKIK